ncbi:MBL fold metallo-hydrolase [Bosea sp. (in: a-proteobacteria)]|uniref:MBL fold metallo-hydrolase n=1 Tax=Bosea sp. (in: a-proteobacteria) TaxID=1871050 RepID=UPI002B4A072F|nr:MBL fold metallo-hydrolase [Bosea sp. (in: a-proteobacteria)]WRH55943.1 MAG: MBL fold metallo-hydrolase [Bosea sp. (in: a-proteobacteria)]
MSAGLAFTFLGTGAPPVSLRRAGPSHLVEAGGCKLLIDCGSGVSQRLVASGHRGADIDLLIVTHEHSDHLVDFYQLVISSWHQGRNRPWRVLAPAPALANLRDQYEAFARERRLRIAFEQRPDASGLDVVFEELQAGPVAGLQGLSVTAFLVDHKPVEPAFGLTLSDGTSRIVFSGDTRLTPTLEQAAENCDLLVSEVYVESQMPVVAGIRTAATVAAVKSYHMTPQVVGDLARRSRAKALAITHIVPPGADTVLLAEEIRVSGYAGPLIIGEDLMRLDWPQRLLRWNGATIGF